MVRFRLFVTARQIRQLLFPDWLLVQATLITLYLQLQRSDGAFAVFNFDLVRLELALHLKKHGRLIRIRGRTSRIVRISRVARGFLQAGYKLIAHFLGFGNLLLQLANVWMAISVV